jgi:hypothetical protein
MYNYGNLDIIHLLEIEILRLTAFKEGAYFMGMKIFNHLPANIKILLNRIELFKPALISSPTVLLFFRRVF